MLSKKHSIPIHITSASAKKFDRDTKAFIHKNLVRHEEIEFSVSIDDLNVSSFHTPHDSMMSVGYKIETSRDNTPLKIAVATDIGYVTDNIRRNLLGCNAVVLESNHDEDMLIRGPYPYDLKKRILSNGGHLSNKTAPHSARILPKTARKPFCSRI